MTAERSLPADHPPCGFYGELCSQANYYLIIIFCVLGGIALLLLIILCVFLWRKKTRKHKSLIMTWKIDCHDVMMVETNELAASSILSHGTILSSGGSLGEHYGRNVARYRGHAVDLTLLSLKNTPFSSDNLLELKLMTELQHKNVCTFIGACFEVPDLILVTEYCSRGNLMDLLQDESLKLDESFSNSFINELIMGIGYIHKSPLKVHGMLKSSSCLLDSRWTLKVADFGLSAYRLEKYTTEQERYAGMLWTAPEILIERNKTDGAIVPGTQAGDVYSFAIIVQEILYRCGPFFVSEENQPSPEEIVRRVCQMEEIPFRPYLRCMIGVDVAYNRLLQLVNNCWHQQPKMRPDFSQISAEFKVIHRGKNFNIVDTMMEKLDAYATNLQKKISERTRELEEERLKSDLLLYSVMPPIIAEKLKKTDKAVAEFFEEASVYFSDIVGFTKLAAESRPLEVVELLNDLYGCLDAIISKHDVYKVETIGDAYTCASGVPIRNPNHAQELAEMALALRVAVSEFQVRHRPDKRLLIRSGLHSGAVVGGVVGSTRPRYCLFGNTVVTANLMESTGKAMRIQMSEDIYDYLVECEPKFVIIRRGLRNVLGQPMETYWLEGREGQPEFDLAIVNS